MIETQQFKIKPNGFNEIRNAILLKTIPLVLISAFAGIALSYYSSIGKNDDINILPFLIPFFIIIITLGLFLGIKRQKLIFNSYTLSISNEMIIRYQMNTPTISMSVNEIKEIHKSKNGAFSIKGNSHLNIIYVPVQIENAEKLEEMLNNIKQIQVKIRTPFLQKYIMILPIITIGLFAAVYLSENKLVVGICGTFLIITLIYSIIEIRRNKNIDYRVKKNLWFSILIILVILYKMFYKLFEL